MRGRRKTALGIDIGPGRVTMALVQQEGRECRIVACGSSPMAPDTSLVSRVTGRGSLDAEPARTLRRLRRQAGIPRMNATLGVSVSPLVLQMLDLPRQMPPNVRDFVENELGQYVTLSGKTIQCDFCAAGTGRDSQRRLLSAAGEKETIRRLVEACGTAGLNVETVEPSILAYVRARRRQRKIGARPGTVLVVEMTDHQLSACLLRRGVLDFVRTKSLPAEIGAVSRGPDHESPVTDPESRVTANDWLVEEIVTMMRHVDSSCVIRDASRKADDARLTTRDGLDWEVDILVREGAPVTAQIAECVKAGTGVLPVVILESQASDPCPVPRAPGYEEVGAGLRPAGTRATSNDAASIPGVLMTAAGLAMRRLDGYGDAGNLDLLPGDVTQARSLVRHALITATVGALVFLGMISSLLVVSRAADGMRERLNHRRMTEQLYLTPVVAAETRVVDGELVRMEQELAEINGALAGQDGVNWSQVLEAVTESMSTDACVTRLSSQDSQRLTLSGLATSGEAVQRLVKALERHSLFESVSLGRVESQPGGRSLVRYEMSCLMRISEWGKGRES